MAQAHESMKHVRETFRVAWYRSPVEQALLKELTQRSDLLGAFQAVGHVALLAITATTFWYLFARRAWAGSALALFAHGTIYSFLPGHAAHELSHGTVFRTRWLNGLFLRFFSLASWFNPYDQKISHTYHHLFTLYPRGDREVVLPKTPSLHPLFLLQLLTLNVVGVRGDLYSYPFVPTLAATIRRAFTGRVGNAWLEAVYEDQEETRRRSIAWARIVLLVHTAVLAVSVILQLWALPLLVTFAPFIANWLRYFVGVPQHTGLRDSVPDFRLCARSITLDPFTSFLYWRMGWHTEHHMYAAVPCYNLKRLAAAIAADMPAPRSLFSAWKEMRQTWKRQKADPAYRFDVPLPRAAESVRASGVSGAGQDPLASSLGSLAPKGLE